MKRSWPSPRLPKQPPPRQPAPPRPQPKCPLCAKRIRRPHSVGAPPGLPGTDRRRRRTARAELAEARRRLGQITQDLTHAGQLQHDSAAAEQRLAAEAAQLAQADLGHDANATAAEAAAVTAGEAVRERRGQGQPGHRSRGRGQRASTGRRAIARPGGAAGQAPERAIPNISRTAPASPPNRWTQPRSPGQRKQRARPDADLTASRQAVERAEHARAPRPTPLAVARDAQTTADFGACPPRRRRAGFRRNPGGQGWRTMAADDRLARCHRWPRSGTGRRTGGGAHVRAQSRSRAALARIAGIRPGASATGVRGGAVGICPRAARLGEVIVADWSNRKRARWRRTSDHSAARPIPGLSLRRDLALGRLHHPRGHADAGGGPPATTQSPLGLARPSAPAEHDAATTRAERTAAEAAAQVATTAEQQARTARRDGEHAAEQARISLTALRNQAATTSARLASADDQLARITLERDEAVAAFAQVARGPRRPAGHRRIARCGQQCPRRSVGCPVTRNHGPNRT